MTILSLRAYSVRPCMGVPGLLNCLNLCAGKWTQIPQCIPERNQRLENWPLSASCPAQMGNRLERRTGHDLYCAILLDIAGAA
jgi:hypothetical protein